MDAPPTSDSAIDATAAAVDLGSNSFHMVVARVLPGGELRVLDRIKHRVRLAGGLDGDGRLTPIAQERALESLRIMGERIQSLRPQLVRAVGTNTLRRARNSLPFLIRASKALGHRIDVISGREEARLIFAGVGHDLPGAARTLIVDIGGGSTEVIVGEERRPLSLDSLYMGCVSFSERFFPGGRVTKAAFKEARTAARQQLATMERRARALGWARAVGSSGTVRAVEKVLLQSGLCPDGLTPAGMARLEDHLIARKRMDAVELDGLSESRRPVLPGGLAILQAVFSALDVDRMQASDSALREGVILDLLGRHSDSDMRAIAARRFGRRFGVDEAQAGRVRDTALGFFDAVAPGWGVAGDPALRLLLGWAADLHEVGIFVSWSGYHKHGAYLLQHADLAGFSRNDQETLAALVLAHRGKLSVERLRSVYRGPVEPVLRTAVLLRLAHRLCRSREPTPIGGRLHLDGETQLVLEVPAGQLDGRPLTRADLADEARMLRRVGLTLAVVAEPGADA